MVKRYISTLVAILIFSVGCNMEPEPGSVSGSIFLDFTSPACDASVTLSKIGGGEKIEYELKTYVDGSFLFQEISVGEYIIHVTDGVAQNEIFRQIGVYSNSETIVRGLNLVTIEDYFSDALEELESYKLKEYDYSQRMTTYGLKHDYFNIGKYKFNSFENNDNVQYDESGLPMLYREGSFQYHPVNLAQFTLSMHGKLVRGIYTVSGKSVLELFINGVLKLVELQQADGSFHYTWDFTHYSDGSVIPAPWSSAMAQGQILSVFARALASGFFLNESCVEIINAGNKAVEFLGSSESEYGPFRTLEELDPELTNYIFFTEYPTVTTVYTLNGYIFTLLGLYDWLEVTRLTMVLKALPSMEAAVLFTEGLSTLELLLPLYDIRYFSCYDLSYLTIPERVAPHFNDSYQRVHIRQLDALHQLSNREIFRIYRDRFIAHVEE